MHNLIDTDNSVVMIGGKGRVNAEKKMGKGGKMKTSIIV